MCLYTVVVVYFQLDNTKTVDNKQTLIHFLVETVEDKFPSCLTFSDELLHVKEAARGERERKKVTLRDNLNV